MLSTTLKAAERLVVENDFIEAARRQDWERADYLWPQLGGMLSDDCWSSAGQLHMQRERWSDAAEALAQLKSPDTQQKLHLTLSRNLASLKQHRPEIYRIIADAEVGDAYRIDSTPTGAPTILMNRGNGKTASLSAGVDPLRAADQVREQLKATIENGQAMALLGIGDGHVFDRLVRQSPTLFLGRRQAMFLIEPDPRLILANLLIHDFTGADGPIESEHVLWYVGPRWSEQLRLAVMTERYLPFPQVTIKLGLDGQPLEQALHIIMEELGKLDIRTQQEISSYYGALPGDHFARIFSAAPSRPPRVLLVTTRFSTVLQYSTRDAADAFRQIGWDAQVMIEPTTYHGLTRAGMRRTVAEFKPDLIFQIDHNRFEHNDLFHPSIPFVNWIQDLLPNLMTPKAGRQLSPRDFVLTPSLQRWTDEFAYPARQCLEFRKLTRVPDRPISWSGRSGQVVYVSNWSQTPAQLREELTKKESGKTRQVMDVACARMIAIYMAGDCLATPGDVRRLLTGVMGELEVAAPESLIRQTTTRLFDRMNNLLYRQQGLSWAVRACDLLGLDLQIHGAGWDKHPDFARYARGPIGYGEELEELTRQAGVNLVLEPFVCIAHQRLLDALSAGGFCLMRNTPGNAILRSLIEVVHRADQTLTTEKSIREAPKNSDDLEPFEQIMRACSWIEADVGFDHVANTRRLIDSGFVPTSGELLPCLENVLFDSAEQMERLLARFTRDDALRSEIATQQRRAVEQRYSYVAGMRRMLRFVAERLANEPAVLERAA